jgi:flagellar motor protein MotB
MLVLYILTFWKLTYQQKATKDQLEKIKTIQEAVKQLPSKYFKYDSTYKRFSLNRTIQFAAKSDVINPQDEIFLNAVGSQIKMLIDKLKLQYNDQNIKYVLIIEGMASNDNYKDNYPLSYLRALAVLRLWERCNVIPDQSICEFQVAGSGTGGLGRYSGAEEVMNQRILIQIVPKIGEIKIE